MMMHMIQRTFLMLLLLTGICYAQQTAGKPKSTARPPAGEAATAPSPEVDLQALVKETELVDMRAHKMGVFWWVPLDFWDASLHAQGFTSADAGRAFEPFGNYNVFLIAVGNM